MGRARAIHASSWDQARVARFWSRVEVGTQGQCWPWRKALDSHGYGILWLSRDADGRQRFATAHRVAWELANGVPPASLTLDHLCRNPRCCNPAHMELVTNAVNVRRGFAARRKQAAGGGS